MIEVGGSAQNPTILITQVEELTPEATVSAVAQNASVLIEEEEEN